MRPTLHRGAEDAITPRLAETRRRYADAYRRALPEAARQFAAWHDAGRALAVQRRAIVRQIAHAAAATGLLKSARQARAGGEKRGGERMNAQISDALDRAGAALKEIGEDIVLLAFFRARGDRGDDRYSVRLALEGSAGGVQESAPTPSAAFTRAIAARAARQASLDAEAVIRAELESRRAGARDGDEVPGAGA